MPNLITNEEAIQYNSALTGNAMVGVFVAMASQLVESYCRKPLSKTLNSDELLNLNGSSFAVEKYPVFNSDPDVVVLRGDGTVIDASNYRIKKDGRGVIFFDKNPSLSTYKEFKITYHSGYDPIPADVKLATGLMVGLVAISLADINRQSKETVNSGTGRIIELEIQGYKEKYLDSNNIFANADSIVPKAVMGLLSNYRLALSS